MTEKRKNELANLLEDLLDTPSEYLIQIVEEVKDPQEFSLFVDVLFNDVIGNDRWEGCLWDWGNEVLNLRSREKHTEGRLTEEELEGLYDIIVQRDLKKHGMEN